MAVWSDLDLIQPLHRGKLTDVWLGRWAGGGRRLAVKRPRGDGAVEALEALRCEASLLTTFEHPHVVELIDIVAPPPRAGRHGPARPSGLVLEPADAGSLADVVARSGALGPVELAAVLAPVAEALGALHERGLVHGDVSPGNLLYDRARGPVVADFGSTVPIGAPLGPAARSTLLFAAPELGQGRPADPRLDVYALGATALWLLAHQAAPRPGVGLRPGPLTGVLLRAVQRDPARRHQSMGHLLVDLAGAEVTADEASLRRHVGRELNRSPSSAVDNRRQGLPALMTERFGPGPAERLRKTGRRRARGPRPHDA